MFATATLAIMMAAQIGPSATMVEQETETREVAYDNIAAGEMARAIADLERARIDNPGDPALLINLGAAYAATGDLARAEECYRQALASEDRYELELASGEWIDSRRAAQMALLTLESRRN